MIKMKVFIDEELYGFLEADGDGELRNHYISQDKKLYVSFENMYLDGGTGHIIEFWNHKYFNEYEHSRGNGWYDFVLARSFRTGRYPSGKKYSELVASNVKELVSKEWISANGRKVRFELVD